MSRVPIGETELGLFHVINKHCAYFTPLNQWWVYDRGFRKGTYAEFKEIYPYYNGNAKYRSKILTKYNQRYNKW